MSLIVNGTTVTKVKVIKDGVETILNVLKVGDTIVFSFMPSPSGLAPFTTYQDGKIVSYGDMDIATFDTIVQYAEKAESGIMSNASAIFLTKYIENNGHPYQTLRRAYIGNTEPTPSFMTEDTHLDILSSDNLAKFKHIYLPVDYYGPDATEIPFDREFIPILSQALAREGAATVEDQLPPHGEEVFAGIGAMSSELYSEKPNVFIFAESAEMAAFRHDHSDALIEKFDIANSEITYYLLFQAYGVEQDTDSTEYESAINYYFGESFISGGDKFGDAKSFYTNTNTDSNLFSNCNSIVMDSINSWQNYFESQGIKYAADNAFYDMYSDAAALDNIYAGPWLSPQAAWPDSDKTATSPPIFFLDKVPRGITDNFKGYYVILGPQAVAESLATELIKADSLIETGAKNNISNIIEVYQAFEKEPISDTILAALSSSATGTTFFNLYLYQAQETASGNELDPTTYFEVGVKE